MIEKIINGSWAHRDILYHSSISGMFKTYFFVGTGIDGFVPHKYHAFSHILFSQLSEIIGINTLDFYSISYPILIIPIFFIFFLYSIKDVSKYFSKINNFQNTNEKNIFLWILLFIFFSIPISHTIVSEKYHYLQSQSYTIALCIFFLIISVFFNYISNTKKEYNSNQFYNYLLPLFILILCIFCSYSKISFILIFSFIGLYFFLRFNLYKNYYLFFLYFIWLLFFISIYLKLIVNFDGKDLILEDILISNSNFKIEFFYAYMSILYVFFKLLSLKIYTWKILIENIVNKKIIDLELLFILIVALYFMPYQYFKGIQLYLSYILIISHINLFLNLVFKK